MQHHPYRIHTLAVVLAAGAFALSAAPLSAGTLARYDFDTLGNAVSNPETPNVAGVSGIFVSSLGSNRGEDGNGDGLGTITANATRDNTPDVFDSMALGIGLGTTAKNPFHATAPTPIVAAQDYLTFTLISLADDVRLNAFSFDYGISVQANDSSGLMSAAQLFYSLNAEWFEPVGARHDRTITGSGGVFTGFTTSTVDLSGLPLLTSADSIEFRLSFGDNSSAATNQKGVYVDNLVLTGDVLVSDGAIPEPAGLAILALAGLGLVRRVRRV